MQVCGQHASNKPSLCAWPNDYSKQCRSRHIRAKIPLSLSAGAKDCPWGEALPSLRFLCPISQTPHIAVCFGASRPLINCSLPCSPTTTVFIPHLRLCYRLCTRPRNTSPPQSRHIVRETSPAWRSQQRLTLVPTSPHQVYLPGGASSPALYIPHLPLPSLLESIYSLRFAPHHSFHLAPFHRFRATLCEIIWTWH